MDTDKKDKVRAGRAKGSASSRPKINVPRAGGSSTRRRPSDVDDETDHVTVRGARPKPSFGALERSEPNHIPPRQQLRSKEATIATLTKSSESDDDEFRYDMDFPCLGEFIIINNKRFEADLGLSERKAADKDTDNLLRQFTKIGFRVKTYDNLNYLSMRRVFKQVSERNHSTNACFGCAILSHGHNWGVYATDEPVSVDTLLKPLKECTTLFGKPKLVFIQACRGDDLDDGVHVEADGPSSTDTEIHKLPSEADILCAYSTTQGYRSFRNKEAGSYFIRELCETLDRYSTTRDIIWMLTRVNYNMAYEFQSRSKDPSIANKKQMPSYISQLTKQLVFYS